MVKKKINMMRKPKKRHQIKADRKNTERNEGDSDHQKRDHVS